MFQEILQTELFHNKVLNYIIWLAVFLAGLFVVYVFKEIVLRRLRILARKTETKIDDFLIRQMQKNLVPLTYWGVFIVSTKYLNFPRIVDKAFNIFGLALLAIFGTLFLLALVDFIVENKLSGKKGISNNVSGINAIKVLINAILIGLAIFLFLDNVGIRISALIAGLGIGGIAVALAAQAMLGDVFSFITILLDKPFEAGDFIIVEDYMGTIEHIGLKTTRIRSLGGEQLVFANSILTGSKIRNYKRMEKRRVVFRLGLTYQTTAERMKEATEIIRDIIKTVEDALFDRVHFFSFGNFSLDIEAVYYVLSSDYNKYMDIQQQINLKIKEDFDKKKLEFAYPTQTIFVSK